MGIKRTAKAGDYKRALSELENRSGLIEGTPRGILAALGFDGSWREFRAYIPNASVSKSETLGRFVVQLSDQNDTYQSSADKVDTIDPEIYAMCASAYVLGEGDPTEFENYVGSYDEIDAITAPLAREIDSSIAGLYLPFRTEVDIEVYSVERSLVYAAEGDGRFMLYGSGILVHA
jgi:hypothetical protein